MELKIFLIDTVNNSGLSVPEMIDYDHIGLFNKRTESKGLTDKAEYFRYWDPQTNVYTDKIVEVNFTYHYSQQANVYTGITTQVNWIKTDEQIGHTREFVKTFVGYEMIDFGLQKRNNIIGTTKLFVLSQIGLANGFDLLESVPTEIELYIQGPITPLTTAIQGLVGVKVYMTQQLADEINLILNNV